MPPAWIAECVVSKAPAAERSAGVRGSEIGAAAGAVRNRGGSAGPRGYAMMREGAAGEAVNATDTARRTAESARADGTEMRSTAVKGAMKSAAMKSATMKSATTSAAAMAAAARREGWCIGDDNACAERDTCQQNDDQCASHVILHKSQALGFCRRKGRPTGETVPRSSTPGFHKCNAAIGGDGVRRDAAPGRQERFRYGETVRFDCRPDVLSE
jgi:hypothetical protein